MLPKLNFIVIGLWFYIDSKWNIIYTTKQQKKKGATDMREFIAENKQAVISFAVLSILVLVTVSIALFANEVTPSAIMTL